MSEKFDADVMSVNGDVIVIFQFMANLQPSGSGIPDAWFIKLTISLAITFFLQNLKTELKNL